jgi:quercetin dioxygenase-like cupin family protein
MGWEGAGDKIFWLLFDFQEVFNYSKHSTINKIISIRIYKVFEKWKWVIVMNDPLDTLAAKHLPLFVPAGEDRFGYFKNLGISSVAFKVTSQESSDLFIVEITLLQKAGPARHVHIEQDEWFYTVEGEFILEVGEERFHLKPGDSAFGPRKVPHVWAFVAGMRGRMIFVVSPIGKLEAFFDDAGKTNTLPGPNLNQWQPYGMEWVGPPLKIE